MSRDSHSRTSWFRWCRCAVLRHDVNATVIGIDQRFLLGVLEACHRGAAVDEGDAAVGVGDQIRGLAEDVAAAAITPEVVGQQAESLEYVPRADSRNRPRPLSRKSVGRRNGSGSPVAATAATPG